jgi:acyl-coenzyme A synthetase/AMP-(fatty) acid ligase
VSGPAGRRVVAGDTNRIVTADHALTWSELPTPADAAGHPIAVLVERAVQGLAAVRHHALTGQELLVVSRSRADGTLLAELRDAGFAVVDGDGILPATRRREPVAGRLWLLTSGSTGRPKRIGHTLDSLTTVRTAQDRRVWLCPYSPGTYAWWQVVTLSLTLPGQDLVVIEPDQLLTWPRLAAEHGVTAASGTPTFWRQTLYSDPDGLAHVPLRQITLGGEPVDQAVLDRLRETFPAARVSWIYASSEVGAAIVVHDGKAGFPVSWLDGESAERPILDVDGDELVITSPYHGEGLTGPVRTGDRVEVRGDRVVITGRIDSDEINVGGAKVSAGAVRGVLLDHPAVAWAAVRARRAPLVGNMVAADVVAVPGERIDAAALSAWCGARLPEYGVPRRIRFLDEIPTKETLKSDV